MSRPKLENQSIFLGKSGKVFGPYSADEVDQMAVLGKLDHYVWMWNAIEMKWNPIEAPPPAPHMSSESTAHFESPANVSTQSVGWAKMQAICYDVSQLVRGTLENLTQTGCTLIVPSMGEVPVVFMGTKAFLNLVDEESGKSYTIAVKLFKQANQGESCRYWLRWNEVPSFLV